MNDLRQFDKLAKMKRICDHFTEGTKIFDSFTFSGKPNLTDYDLDNLEIYLIKKHMPKYNLRHNE
jgi:hypothetical protein